MINFYRRFVPHAVHIMKPLHDMLTGNRKKKKEPLVWNNDADRAFQATLQALSDATMLVHPKSNAPTSILTDASATAVGGVLQQHIDGQWKPLSFFSKKLQPAETRYSTFDRELLAVYLTIRHFRFFLEGRTFAVFTDHKPLTHALNLKSDSRSPRQIRHLSFISEFTNDIRYIKGANNSASDALSRADITCNSPIDYEKMATDQLLDEELLRFKDDSESSLQLKSLDTPLTSQPLYCDVSTGKPRPFVPEQYRRQIFDKFHGLAHPGINGTTSSSLNASFGRT
ncbi:Uncharacterised protein r2_g1051 [Pycnogonum litorale]